MLWVLGAAARLYFHFLPIILVLATVLFGIAGLVDYLTELWSTHLEGAHQDVVPTLELVPFLFTTFASIALLVESEPLFAALVDKTLHPAIEGGSPTPLRQVLTGLPYLRVIVTSLLFLLVVLVGIVLLVLPGLAAYALLGLAVPLVVAEDLRPLAAFRRSWALLRRNRVIALLLVLLPAILSELLGEGVDDLAHALPWWGKILVEVGFDATLPAYTGVVLAVLAVSLPPRTPRPER